MSPSSTNIITISVFHHQHHHSPPHCSREHHHHGYHHLHDITTTTTAQLSLSQPQKQPHDYTKPYSTYFQKIRTKIQGAVHNIIRVLHVLTKYAINARSNSTAVKAIHITVCESGRYRGPTNSPDSINMGMNTLYNTEPTKNLDTKICQNLVANAETKPTVVVITMLG